MGGSDLISLKFCKHVRAVREIILISDKYINKYYIRYFKHRSSLLKVSNSLNMLQAKADY